MEYSDFEENFGLWAPQFKPFIESREMFDIYQRLKSDALYPDGRRKETIVPHDSLTFRAFSTTNPERLKVVFYLMDPYPRQYRNRVNQATGIAMDCSNTPDGKLQPSLTKFYDAIDKELNTKVLRSPSLEYLHEQGVMMLNTDLTCKLNKTGSHEGLWEPFQKYFLEEVLRGKQMIFVLCGKASHKIEPYISPFGNTIIKLDHPAFAERQKTDWNSKGTFNQINKILAETGGKIFWDKREWDEEVPF